MKLEANIAALNAKIDALLGFVEVLANEQKAGFEQIEGSLGDVLAHEDNRVYNCAQVAELLGVSRDTVRSLSKRGEFANLPGVSHIAVTGRNLKKYLRRKPNKYDIEAISERMRALAA